MILRRLGRKTKIANIIISHFPKHTLYIEPFFGAGGLFFNKPKAKYNILNDLDSDVYNLYNVVLNQKKELIKTFKKMPIHIDLWNYWKENEEKDPIKKAIRFLFLSNFGFLGQRGLMRVNSKNTAQLILDNIEKTQELLFKTTFTNCCFEKMLGKIDFTRETDKKKAFIYCDPPYLDTGSNYSHGFTEKLSLKLFETLQNSNLKWAMSEFNHPFILEQAKNRNLNVIFIKNKRTLRSRNSEILITNYKNIQTSLFSN